METVEKPPISFTFHGSEHVGYDFRESGGEPIVSTLDEISFGFKTQRQKFHGLLFYSGMRFYKEIVAMVTIF